MGVAVEAQVNYESCSQTKLDVQKSSATLALLAVLPRAARRVGRPLIPFETSKAA